MCVINEILMTILIVILMCNIINNDNIINININNV